MRWRQLVLRRVSVYWGALQSLAFFGVLYYVAWGLAQGLLWSDAFIDMGTGFLLLVLILSRPPS